MKTRFRIYHFLILAGLLFSLYRVHMAYQWVDINAADNLPDVQFLILAPSICTYNTGIFLAHCTSKADITAVENVYTGDLGYTLLSNSITYFKKKPLTKADAVKINIWLNWAGVIFFAIALIFACLKYTAIVAVFIGSYFIQGKEISMDHYGSLFGVFCIAIGGMIFFALANNRNYYKYRILFFLISLFALMSALLLREPIGLIGMAGTLFILIINFVEEKAKWSRKILKYSVMVLMIYSITLVPSFLITARTLLWNVPKGKFITRHGISHSLMVGLGRPNTPNSWGITRSDLTALKIVENIDPAVVPISSKYYTILWNMYVQMFISQPLEIINIYWQCLLITLDSPTKIMNYYFYIAVLFVLMIVVARRLKGRLKIVFTMILGLGVASVLAIMQGVLSHSWFASIAEIGFIVSILALLEIFVKSQKVKNVSKI